MTRYLVAAAVLIGFAPNLWAGPTDLFEEKIKDFGTSPRGTVLVHYFRFTNTTNQTLTAGNPRVSCGCVSAGISKTQIAPGESAAVIAYMDTRRIPTPNVTKTVIVYVPFLAPNVEEVSLRVTTVARDDLLMTPDTLAFGNIKFGQGGKVSTKVTFTSDPNWTITEAISTGGYVKADFKLESRNGGLVTYEVTATLEKNCPAGNWVSDFNLKTSNDAVAKLRIPVTVNVTPGLLVTPGSVSLGDMELGTPSETKVTVQGGAPFKILDVKGGDEQLSVKVEKTEASAVHVIVFAANPKAAGGFSRTVEITTDSKDQPKIVVPVTAKVVAP